MKELQVGQKKWTIQLGECVVVGVDFSAKYPYSFRSSNSPFTYYYTRDLKLHEDNYYPSVFESNPFERSVDTTETIEPKLIRQQNDGWVGNKAELINALGIVLCSEYCSTLNISIANNKLQKLLESI